MHCLKPNQCSLNTDKISVNIFLQLKKVYKKYALVYAVTHHAKGSKQDCDLGGSMRHIQYLGTC